MTVLPTLKASVLAAAARRAHSEPAIAIAPRAWQRRWQPSKWLFARGSGRRARHWRRSRWRRAAAMPGRSDSQCPSVPCSRPCSSASRQRYLRGGSGTAWGAELVSFANASHW